MIKRFTILLFSVGLMLLVIGLPESHAEKDKRSAVEIMEMVGKANMTMDQRSIVTMILIDKLGNERKVVTLRLHKHGHGHNGIDNKSVFFTQYPPDQKGTGFLIWDYAIKDKADDLWLYLPALRTVRRMTTRDQHDSFMGSDLTFADMGARRLDEDDHKLLFDGNCKDIGEPCYVVQSTPKEKNSPYGYKRFFISKKNKVAMKIEFFDRNKKPLKLQTITWYKVGKVLVWERSEIVNVQNKHKTIFEITDVENDIGIEDSSFSDRMLKRGGGR